MDRWVLRSEAAAAKQLGPNTLVVNLYGGPGTGKSTTAAGLFYTLKSAGIGAELVTEYAKDLVWQRRHACLADQIYIFAKQQRRVATLFGQVEVVVTDSPILLSMVYARDDFAPLCYLVRETHRSWNTLDIFLERNETVHPYVKAGRLQEVEGARRLDSDIWNMLRQEEPQARVYAIADNVVDYIYQAVRHELDTRVTITA